MQFCWGQFSFLDPNLFHQQKHRWTVTEAYSLKKLHFSTLWVLIFWRQRGGIGQGHKKSVPVPWWPTGDGWAGLDQEYPSLGSLPQSMEDAWIPTSGTTKLITSLWQSTDWPTCRNSPLKLPFPWRNLLHARIAMKSADHKESGAWSREYGRHFPCSSEHYEKVTRVWSLSLMTISFIHISIQTYFPSILRLLSTYFQASFHFSARIGFLLEIPMSHLLRRGKTGFKPVYVKKLKLFSNGCSLPFWPYG